jgi:hypothetical protein
MFHLFFSDNEPWFEQKPVGYGSGWPIAWQGWVLMLSYIAVMLGLGVLAERMRDEALVATIAGMLLATIAFVVIARARTRGGWRWRRGEDG